MAETFHGDVAAAQEAMDLVYHLVADLGITGQALVFTVFVALVGTGAVRRCGLKLENLKVDEAPLAVSLLAKLDLTALAASISLVAITSVGVAHFTLGCPRGRSPPFPRPKEWWAGVRL